VLVALGAGLLGAGEPRARDRSQTGELTPAPRGALAGPTLCAVPPVPGKAGRNLESHFGPPRAERPLRALGEPAALRGAPAPDTIRTLAIQVDFDDQEMDSTRVYFERAFEFMGQYWSEVTDSKIVVETHVTEEVYRLPESQAYYGDDELFAERQTLFLRDAVQAADPDYYLPDYDVHIAVHAGAGQEADVNGDSPEQLWSVFAPFDVFQAYLPDSTASQGIATQDLGSDGQPYFVQFALVLPEVESQDCDDRFEPCRPFIFGLTGVYAHEFGHALGLPDLYDTTPSDFADSQGIGAFDIMAHGTWNANGFVPARPSAWSLFDLGVLDPEIIREPGTVSLAAVARRDPGGLPRLVAIPVGGDEYFLLENRVQDPNANQLFDFHDVDNDSLFSFYVDDYADAEFDFFLPGDGSGSGLLIWHIDPSVISANFVTNTVVADAAHKGVDLEEADGVEDMDGFPRSIDAFGSPYDAYRAGNATRFADDTVPSSASSYGVPTLVTIDQVSAADSVMTFQVTFDGRLAGPNWPVTIDGPLGGNPAAVGDFTANPGLETVFADTTGGIWVIAADGSQPLGSPFDRVGPDLATAPALGDLDGLPGLELVVAASDGRIFAWQGTGAELRDGDQNPGTTGVWATTGRSLAGAVPVLMPVGGIGARGLVGAAVVIGCQPDTAGVGALLWCQDNGVTGVVHALELPGDTTAPPIVFPGLSPVVLTAAVTDGRTRFFAVSPLANGGAGSFVDVTPATGPSAGAVRTLIAGDLDGDGTYEAIAGDDQGRIAAYSTGIPVQGEPTPTPLALLPGWPFEIGIDVAHDLALADVDQDGRHEILVSAYDGRLFALNFNGTPQLSFPANVGSPDRVPPRIVPSPLAFDLEGGPGAELVFAPGDGRSFAYDGQGRTLAGWPRPGPAAKGTGLVIEDLDQADGGRLELIVPSDFGARTVLIGYDLGVVEGPGSTWRGYRGGPARAGVLTIPPAENPEPGPVLSQLFVYPNPVTGDRANIHFLLGGESQVRVQILDSLGRLVAEPLTSQTLPPRTDHEVRWDVRDAASGVYLLRLTVVGEGRDVIEIQPFAVTR
jgi:hypothetical protein